MATSITQFDVGQFGNYHVGTETISTRFFVTKIETRPDGTKHKVSIPIRRSRRNVVLTHVRTNDFLVFSAYNARGEKRYKDSRVKTSTPLINPIVAEIKRLLEIDETKAKELLDPNNFIGEEKMISVKDLQALTDAENTIATNLETEIDKIIAPKYAADPECKVFEISSAEISKVDGVTPKIKNAVAKRYADNGWKTEIVPAGMILRIPHKGAPKGVKRGSRKAAETPTTPAPAVETVLENIQPTVVATEAKQVVIVPSVESEVNTVLADLGV